jgi:RNA polymerase sigma-70 factor, ECF subfamily
MAAEQEQPSPTRGGEAPGDDLRALVARALGGDRDATAGIYARFHATVLAIQLGHTRGDMALAQDLTQDTFTKALYRLDQFEWRGPESLRGWLATIARNTFRDHVRSAAERHHGGYELPDVAGDTDETPEAVVVDRDTAGTAARAASVLDRLKPEHRLVLRRTLGEGCSAREVAEELGRSEAAIHQLKRRALLAAREIAAEDAQRAPP